MLDCNVFFTLHLLPVLFIRTSTALATFSHAAITEYSNVYVMVK